MKIDMKESEMKKRIREDWSRYAGERVRIDLPNHDTSWIIAYGSELACLRLFKRFASEHTLQKGKDKIKVDFIESLDTWSFSVIKY